MSSFTKTEDTLKGVLIAEEHCTYYGNVTLEYYLYKEASDGFDIYSVRVIQKNDGEEVCRSFAYDISHSYDFAGFIFNSIVKGLVPPYCLKEILYDFMP